MGDVDDAQLLGAQVADDLEQLLDLRLGQRGGGLVEYDDLGLVADGLGDLAHLLLADGQVAHLLGGVDVDAQLMEQLAGLLVHPGVVDQAALHELAADEDVLGHRQVVHHVQLLVNDDDARLLGLAGVVEFHLAPLVGDGAGILGVDAGQHLHQRGFARAVFTHQRVHLALAHLQIDVIQRVHAGERFVDALHRQYDFSHDTSSISIPAYAIRAALVPGGDQPEQRAVVARIPAGGQVTGGGISDFPIEGPLARLAVGLRPVAQHVGQGLQGLPPRVLPEQLRRGPQLDKAQAVEQEPVHLPPRLLFVHMAGVEEHPAVGVGPVVGFGHAQQVQ